MVTPEHILTARHPPMFPQHSHPEAMFASSGILGGSAPFLFFSFLCKNLGQSDLTHLAHIF